MLKHLFSWVRGALIGGVAGAVVAGCVFTLSATPVSSIFQDSGALASYLGGHATQDGHGNTLNSGGYLGLETPKPSPKPTEEPSATPSPVLTTPETSPLPSSKPSETPHPTYYPYPSLIPTPAPSSSAQPVGCSEAKPCTNMVLDEQFADDTVGAAQDDWNITGNWLVAPVGKVNKVHTDGAGMLQQSVAANDYVFLAGINIVDQSTAGAVAARMQDANNFYACAIQGNQLELKLVKNGSATELASAAVSPAIGWNFLSLQVSGNSLNCSSGAGTSKVSVTASDSTFPTGGGVALIAASSVDFAEIVAETN